jgi:PAS domain S-box-containing protein
MTGEDPGRDSSAFANWERRCLRTGADPVGGSAGKRLPPPSMDQPAGWHVAADRVGQWLHNGAGAAVENMLRAKIERQAFAITDHTSPGHPIVFVSDGLLNETGYSRSEILGRSCNVFYGDETDGESAGELQKSVDSGTPCEVKLYTYRKDGSTMFAQLQAVPVRNGSGPIVEFIMLFKMCAEGATSEDSDEDPVGTVTSLIDCGHEAEHLRRNQPDPESEVIFSIANPRLSDCPLTFVSQGFLSMTGYTLEEVVGSNCRFLQGPKTEPESIARLRHAVTNGLRCTVAITNYKKDGVPFQNVVHLMPVRDPDGKLHRIVGCQIDCTAMMLRLGQQRRGAATARALAAMETAAAVDAAYLPDYGHLCDPFPEL